MHSVSDRDIEATALIVFREHGRSASYYARGRAETLRDEGARTGAETWDGIAAICEQWEREREPCDSVQ
jgi:hypothetical protein